jgi:hypothetical protein
MVAELDVVFVGAIEVLVLSQVLLICSRIPPSQLQV